MTTDLGRASFQLHEWEVLFLPTMLIPAAMRRATNSGIVGNIEELFAAEAAPAETAKAYPENKLIQELALPANEPNVHFMLSRKDGAEDPDSFEAMRRKASRALHEAENVLLTKGTPELAAEYKQWLYDIAEHVARSAKEGGVFGIGGKDVSAGESAYLKMLKRDLGL
jgi:hypothetical protein